MSIHYVACPSPEAPCNCQEIRRRLEVKDLEATTDPVNHPAHYIAKNGMEAIDVIEGFELNHHLATATAYILRCGKKLDAIEDLKKARWYIDREIKRREGK